MDKQDTLKTLLKKEGYRHTPARKAMLAILENETAPISAEELYLKVKNELPSVNLSTIYRSLDLFTCSGILNKVVYNDGKARYKIYNPHHQHHLICVGCNKTIYIDSCPFHMLEQRLEDETSFSITGHSLEITGYCPACQEQKPKE